MTTTRARQIAVAEAMRTTGAQDSRHVRAMMIYTHGDALPLYSIKEWTLAAFKAAVAVVMAGEQDAEALARKIGL